MQSEGTPTVSIKVSTEQARAAGHIIEKPLVVLTAEENSDAILSSGLRKHDFGDYQRIWVDDLQMRLARLSTRVRRILVSGSGHDITSDRRDSIVKALPEVRAAATNSDCSHSGYQR